LLYCRIITIHVMYLLYKDGGKSLILNFDESGNLGKSGRYFTIACVGSTDMKPLANVVKKASLKTKQTFPKYSDFTEIKAKDSYPFIKDYFLNKIVSKDIDIRYIVADLNHVKKSLIDDENLLYNYMLQFLIVPVAMRKDINRLVLNLDKRSVKVGSINSFADYIRIELNYRLGLNIEVEVNYFESQNSYAIQAADFVANAINSKYEYNYNYFYDILRPKIVHSELFPRRLFGTGNVVGLPLKKV
jgi:hypothetical protein